MIVPFSVIVGIIVIAFVLSPFFIGEGGALESGSSLNDLEKIESMKVAFLKRYLQEEQAMKEGLISKGTWNTRKQFLTGRYIDVSRRGDFLAHQRKVRGAE